MNKPEPIQEVGGEAIRKFREGTMLLEKSRNHAINHSCDNEGRKELNMRTQSPGKKMKVGQKKTYISEVIFGYFLVNKVRNTFFH